MTERLLAEFRNKISLLTLQPSSGGRFEVSINGETVFSKDAAGRFPTVEEIRSVVTAKL